MEGSQPLALWTLQVSFPAAPGAAGTLSAAALAAHAGADAPAARVPDATLQQRGVMVEAKREPRSEIGVKFS